MVTIKAAILHLEIIDDFISACSISIADHLLPGRICLGLLLPYTQTDDTYINGSCGELYADPVDDMDTEYYIQRNNDTLWSAAGILLYVWY